MICRTCLPSSCARDTDHNSTRLMRLQPPRVQPRLLFRDDVNKALPDGFRCETFRLCRVVNHFCSEDWLSPDDLPSSKPSTLISSSRSGQWIPSPLAMSRQLPRSFRVP